MRTVALLLVIAMLALSPSAHGQALQDQADLVDRPISAIRLVGLVQVTQQEVLNNIRAAVGEPYDPQVVREDVRRLNRLGRFGDISALAELQADGSVAIIYEFREQAIINVVQVVGNRLITDQELLAVVQQVPLGPRDDFLIQNAKGAIEALYRRRGHYLAAVSVDESELESAGLLIFRVIEGPRVRVRAVEFQGNEAFNETQLGREVRTRTALFMIRRGELDEEQLTDDVAALDRYYKERGYLDARVDRQIELSPDSSEAKVTFLIAEGQPYRVRHINAATMDGQPLRVFLPEQLAAIVELRSGDIYRLDLLRRSVVAVEDAYGLMGYLDVRVRPWANRVGGDQPLVDLLLEVDEGRQYKVGTVDIEGNFLTRDRVIRRELRGITPGRPFDVPQIRYSEQRLLQTRLFSDARITAQAEDPENPGYRDVLVEVRERQTGSLEFGVAVGSDSGAYGNFSITQNNFDITAFPESIGDMFTGRAFRGGGQRFNMTLRPGTELFQFITSWTEPHLFDTDYSLTLAGQFRNRFFERYDEERAGGSFRLGRQFGDFWNIGLQGRLEGIELSEIDPEAPTEIFLDAGPDFISTLGVGLTRSTITRLVRPGSGSHLDLAYDRYGGLGGDFDFNRVTAEYTSYYTLHEDFLGRLSTLRLTGRLGYIFGGGRSPTYERFYLGGRTFRGFDFRTISPKGIRADTGEPSDDAVGGEWMAFAGAQYEVPIFADTFTGVLFLDTGTVSERPSLDDFRVAAGVGVRLYIPQLVEVPIALDFGFPIVKRDGDDTRIFSFTFEVPF